MAQIGVQRLEVDFQPVDRHDPARVELPVPAPAPEPVGEQAEVRAPA